MKYLEIIRGVWALTELIAPRWMPGMVLGSTVDGKSAAVIRVLGTRDLVQAIVTIGGSRHAHRAGGNVDILHAISMLGVAALNTKHRSLAAASAVVAIVFAIGERVTSR